MPGDVLYDIKRNYRSLFFLCFLFDPSSSSMVKTAKSEQIMVKYVVWSESPVAGVCVGVLSDESEVLLVC